VREGQKSFIPIRINSAGVMPIIFAQAIIIVPGTLYSFTGGQGGAGILYDISQIFQPGSTWYYITYAALIIVFTYVYTAIIFNPVDLAENLKKQGGFIPGVKPGVQTAEYIDHVQTFFFGGTSLLIVVGVALDTVQQMQQHLLLRQYEGFMKKGRVKYRGRQKYM